MKRLSSTIRPESLYRQYINLAAEEERRFLDPVTASVRPEMGTESSHCVACGVKLRSGTFQGYKLCGSCGTLNSAPRINPDYLETLWQEGGASDFFHRHVYLPSAVQRRNIMRKRLKIIKRFLNEGHVLDIGCSIGIFLDLLKKDNFLAEGVEVLPFAVSYARAKGHIVHNRSIEMISLAEGGYDAVFAWEVIAHLEEPLLFMKTVFNLLKRGGHFFLTTPNGAALEYDTIWMDGQRHHANLKPHVFLQIFGIEGIKTLASKAGFEILELSTPGSMDVRNVTEAAHHCNLQFSNRFFSELFLGKGKRADAFRNQFQKMLTSTGNSVHIFLIMEKE